MINIEAVKNNTPDTIMEIIQFLYDVDNEFEESLSSRMNISEYVVKIMRFGKILMAREKNVCIGMVAFYSNDTINHIGTYTILVIKPGYRGQKLGTELFLRALEMMHENGMKRAQLGAYANNRAIRLYEKLGFKIIETNYNNPNAPRITMEYVFPMD